MNKNYFIKFMEEINNIENIIPEENNENKLEKSEINEKSKKDNKNEIENLLLYIDSCISYQERNEQIFLYKLKGKILKTENIMRKYSDFILLQNKISEFLPGIFIGGIPSENLLLNNDDNVIKMKIKLLTHFIKQINEIPNLFKIEPLLFFLDNDDNYLQYLYSLNPGNSNQIKNRFIQVFPDFKYENYNKIDDEKFIDYWNKVFINSKENIFKICQNLQQEMLNIKKEESILNNIINMFIDFENTINDNKSIIKNKNKLCGNINDLDFGKTLLIFYHYHLKTFSDLNSFIEAHNKIVDYRNLFNNSLEILKKITMTGKSKYSILKSLKEEGVQQLKNYEIGYIEECNMLDLKYIVDISTYVLKNQIINFKNNFFEKYKMEIEKMQKNLINKNLKSKQLWEEFMYDLN